MERNELEQALLAAASSPAADGQTVLGFVRDFKESGRRGWVTLQKGLPDPPGLFTPSVLRKMPEYVAYQEKIRARPYTVMVWECDDTDDLVREMTSTKWEERNFADLDAVEEYLEERCGSSLIAVGPILKNGRKPM